MSHAARLLPNRVPSQREGPERDPSTLSNYEHFKPSNTAVALQVNWGAQKLAGSVTYDLAVSGNPDKLVLDTSYLDIQEVQVNGHKADFSIGERHSIFGSPLTIALPSNVGDKIQVKISYATTPSCTALQWLTPEQTAGKKAPYFFSQCQAIHARSVMPAFDTPSVKSTFDIEIESEHPVVASGLPIKGQPGKYVFRQKVPIPAYLFALAGGDLDSAPIGPRSDVYSEPCDLHKCQYEFEADTEKFINAAEKIVFPYEWEKYDVLVLPPSFPYGGMENPNITFATPTLVSGDRQNVDVIAHELAHSWSGNLVTNCSWEHFWLNEGWTVYLERRIVGALEGEQQRHFSAIIGWNALEESVKLMSRDPVQESYTQLVVDLKPNGGADPDDAFSSVPYEKGSTFLFFLETEIGQAKFDPFVKHYFKHFRYKSLDTYQFIDCLFDFYANDQEVTDKLNAIDWEKTLFAPGLPTKPKFDTTLADECYSLAARWKDASDASAFSASDIASFNSSQMVVFLITLSEYEGKDGFSWANKKDLISKMGDIYSLATSSNPEVIAKWYGIAILAKVESEYLKLADWLATVGRMKFVRPGYRALNSVDPKLAKETFEKNKDFYHPICRDMVAKDLQ
ncbi:Leukotriene A-4 hydrolase-like protein [Yarrowia sp. B02]|nr:Leukotriene A-4 hydrolase-like protein [Yarrowia sp. B02]